MDARARVVNCPTCGQPVAWRPENRWRPFCSERCRLIDLGEWAAERYRLPAEPALGSGPDEHAPAADTAPSRPV
ncbi:MAG: DNA gyrase inhibitor YacG [Thiobacillaceae bacterium]|nr:DNA gyrase inhibitor YacG [Thiobacillaceae bacterium]MCX7673012.1 DNA gyrase inhibitor YacG [Thiobacillaceae bacterium]MDW8323475.1 DNA gyrase inhibitor YacG [Burkholderiales bacterium]